MEQFAYDYYRINVTAGQQIRIVTTTPGDGPFEISNTGNPDIQLYDQNFGLILDATAGAADGRNVNVVHTPTQSGAYYILVNNFNSTNGPAGEYTLQVTGLNPALPPFEITSTTPFNGQSVQGPPVQYTVNFNRSVLISSVDPSDLTVDGVPSTAVTSSMGTRPYLRSHNPFPEIRHTVQIAAGAILDVQAAALGEYNGFFFVDMTAPRITSSSIQEGDLIPAGDLVYVVRFNERMNQFSLTSGDFALVGAGSQQQFQPDSATFDGSGQQLTITYRSLPDDHYTLTLFSGAGSMVDLSGRPLDGEPVAFPLPPGISGDGVDGGNFSVSFDIDVDSAPPQLAAASPAGSFIYEALASGGSSPATSIALRSIWYRARQ